MNSLACLILICFSFQQAGGQTDSIVPGGTLKGKKILFNPTSFSNKFSLNTEPVLRIHPGDTVLTETIDAFGRDKNGTRRQGGGNPLTGPFFIEGAMKGDILAITLTKVALNRSYAFTSLSFVSRSMPDSIVRQFKKPGIVKWTLDIEKGIAKPADSALEKLSGLTGYSVPLHPFLGCIGVAPSNKKNEILSFFQGTFGGNMDFAGVTKGATLYLPVFHDGAYFYIGDGHAVQGDGEIAGNALETSLDVGFTIGVIKKSALHSAYPRLEDSVYIMSAGTAKTLDDAIKIATSGLLAWLQNDYQLTLDEATQVMSTAIEYVIAEMADPEVLVVARIKKKALFGLNKK